MLLFDILSTASLYLGIIFCSVCLATGLYCLSEIAEMYSMRTKNILRYITIGILIAHVFLLVDSDVSRMACLIGIVSHLVYYQLIQNFPFIDIMSLQSIASIIMFILSHLSWYFLFFRNAWFIDGYSNPFNGQYHKGIPTFSETVGFFFTMVWLIPGGFLITLSINTFQLPGSTDHLRSEIKPARRLNLSFCNRKKRTTFQ